MLIVGPRGSGKTTVMKRFHGAYPKTPITEFCIISDDPQYMIMPPTGWTPRLIILCFGGEESTRYIQVWNRAVRETQAYITAVKLAVVTKTRYWGTEQRCVRVCGIQQFFPTCYNVYLVDDEVDETWKPLLTAVSWLFDTPPPPPEEERSKCMLL